MILVPHEEVWAERFYACYCIGLFFDDTDFIWLPTEFCLVDLSGFVVGATIDLTDETHSLGDRAILDSNNVPQIAGTDASSLDI